MPGHRVSQERWGWAFLAWQQECLLPNLNNFLFLFSCSFPPSLCVYFGLICLLYFSSNPSNEPVDCSDLTLEYSPVVPSYFACPCIFLTYPFSFFLLLHFPGSPLSLSLTPFLPLAPPNYFLLHLNFSGTWSSIPEYETRRHPFSFPSLTQHSLMMPPPSDSGWSNCHFWACFAPARCIRSSGGLSHLPIGRCLLALQRNLAIRIHKILNLWTKYVAHNADFLKCGVDNTLSSQLKSEHVKLENSWVSQHIIYCEEKTNHQKQSFCSFDRIFLELS